MTTTKTCPGIDLGDGRPSGCTAARTGATDCPACEPVDWRALCLDLLDGLPRCSVVVGQDDDAAGGLWPVLCREPATKAFGRGGPRYCDGHGEGVPDYPRAAAVRAIEAARAREAGPAWCPGCRRPVAYCRGQCEVTEAGPVGLSLAEVRRALGLTVHEVARDVDTMVRVVELYEDGIPRPLPDPTREATCDRLDVYYAGLRTRLALGQATAQAEVDQLKVRLAEVQGAHDLLRQLVAALPDSGAMLDRAIEREGRLRGQMAKLVAAARAVQRADRGQHREDGIGVRMTTWQALDALYATLDEATKETA